MSDVVRRIARWQVECTPERTKATLDSIREDMRTRYEAATTQLTLMETDVGKPGGETWDFPYF